MYKTKVMIAEDYVSYEVAKLLKEKGFDEPCYRWYDGNGDICAKFINPDVPLDYFSRERYLCPTLQMAMKWLLKKYNIFICILYLEDLDGFGYTIEDVVDKKCIASSGDSSYKEPEQACEAAIKYCLEGIPLN